MDARPHFAWLRRSFVAAVCIGLPIVGHAISAGAATGCIAGFTDAGGNVCTKDFVYTGAPESFTLPPDVGMLTAVVSGAQGGTSLEEQVDPFGGAASPGGKGGRETATMPTTLGGTFTVVVGQAGTGGNLAPPGYGGYGGGGHATSRNGGNGGGGSFVFDTTDPNTTALLVAGGGGGGGGYDYSPVVMGRGDQQAPGGDGSGASPATDGISVPFCCDGTAPYNAGGGGGATPTGPGLGGHPTLPPSYVFGQADGDPGSGPAMDPSSFGYGGNTHNGCCYYVGLAGGGGGGYYGGGGGGNIEADLEGGGGGGGAGFVTPAATIALSETGVQIGDGLVTISYSTIPSATTTTTPSASTSTSTSTSSSTSSTSTSSSTTSTTIASTVDQLLTGKRLSLKDAPDASKQKASARSTDAAIVAPVAGSGDDPTRPSTTSSVRIVSTAGGFDGTYPLPSSGWILSAPTKGFKYSDRTLANGPVISVQIKAGKLVKISAKRAGLALDLTSNPNPVSVTVETGSRRWCMTFGGTVKFTSGKTFRAAGGLAPSGCVP